MNRWKILMTGLLTLLMVAPVVAGDGHADGHGHGDMDEAAQMEAMMKLAQPGPMHEHMKAMAGKWTTTTTMNMPGAEPSKTTGDANFELVLDGRFLVETGNGEMMGMPFKGMSMWGYNNASETFESVWTYTMSTGMLFFEGKGMGDDATIEWNGRYGDTSGEPKTMRMVSRVKSNDNWVCEMYEKAPDGTEFVMMKIEYSRTPATGK